MKQKYCFRNLKAGKYSADSAGQYSVVLMQSPYTHVYPSTWSAERDETNNATQRTKLMSYL